MKNYDVCLNNKRMQYYQQFNTLNCVQLSKLITEIVEERNKLINDAFETRYPGLLDEIKKSNENQTPLMYQGKFISGLNTQITLDPNLENLIDAMFQHQRTLFKSIK